MPVSRKRPARKATAAAPVLPTRRMREVYHAATPPDARAAALSEANAIVARGQERDMDRLRIAAAHAALQMSPLCAEAYIALAETRADPADAADYFKRGINAAELALGPEPFVEHAGQLWTFEAARPYMAARYGLALSLLEMEQDEQALDHLRTLLALNPADDQGIRYTLLPVLLDDHDLTEARDLIAAFAQERTTFWLYSRLLIAYRDEAGPTPSTAALAAEAMARNPFVPGILAETQPDAEAEDGISAPGSAEEATDYVLACERPWTETPGAVDWLVRLTAAVADI